MIVKNSFALNRRALIAGAGAIAISPLTAQGQSVSRKPQGAMAGAAPGAGLIDMAACLPGLQEFDSVGLKGYELQYGEELPPEFTTALWSQMTLDVQERAGYVCGYRTIHHSPDTWYPFGDDKPFHTRLSVVSTIFLMKPERDASEFWDMLEGADPDLPGFDTYGEQSELSTTTRKQGSGTVALYDLSMRIGPLLGTIMFEMEEDYLTEDEVLAYLTDLGTILEETMSRGLTGNTPGLQALVPLFDSPASNANSVYLQIDGKRIAPVLAEDDETVAVVQEHSREIGGLHVFQRTFTIDAGSEQFRSALRLRSSLSRYESDRLAEAAAAEPGSFNKDQPETNAYTELRDTTVDVNGTSYPVHGVTFEHTSEGVTTYHRRLAAAIDDKVCTMDMTSEVTMPESNLVAVLEFAIGTALSAGSYTETIELPADIVAEAEEHNAILQEQGAARTLVR